MALDITVLTGQSGSGKSTAIHALEDQGYQCVDNLPPNLVEPLAEQTRNHAGVEHLAVVMDVREMGLLKDAPALIERLRTGPDPVRIIYFEALEEVLIRRFSETRRRHPLDHGKGLKNAMAREEELLAPLRAMADQTIETSDMTPHQLRAQVLRQLVGVEVGEDLRVSLLSFGFKYGVPVEVDILLDVRFLPNPYFVPELRSDTGLDARVRDYVIGSEHGGVFVEKTFDYLSYLLPHFQGEGKRYLTIGIGCTGGQHRSVAIAVELAKQFGGENVKVDLRHRDVSGARR